MHNLALITDAWYPQINGVVTTLQKMLEYSTYFGYNIKVIHPGYFKTIPTPTYSEIRTVVNPWKLKKYLQDIDYIHIATEGSLGIYSRYIAHKNNWNYTSGFHTNFPEYISLRTKISPKLTYPLFRKLNTKSSAILVPSESTKEKLVNKGFNNIIVWSRGFDEKIFNINNKSINFSDKLKLLYVGRVAVEKNLKDLLQLSDKYDITIVGDGPAKGEYQKNYKNVSFVGYKKGKELAEYYKSANVFVFPSLTDTFGIVMIEAMACGTPVAAYPVEGPKDAVLHNVGGYLSTNLVEAIENAALLDVDKVLENAKLYSWQQSAKTFFDSLVHI